MYNPAIDRARAQKGFTLIELCITTLLVGLFLAAFSPVYALYLNKKAIEKTKTNVEVVTSTLSSFLSVYGRYPCPASPTAVHGDAIYGHEPDAPANCSDSVSIPVGGCDPATGVCVEQSADMDPDPAVTDFRRVRIGSIPFRELNIEESATFDGYGNRLTYAVTEELAVASSFRPERGGVAIVDEQNVSVINPPGTAHFVVLSHGKDGSGAYTSGGIRNICAAGTMEAENCDAGNAVFRTSQRSDAINAGQYDDLVSFFGRDPMPLWQAAADEEDQAQKYPGKIGINISSPLTSDPNSVLEVQGSVRAKDDPDTTGIDEGKALSNNICGFDGSGDCFPVTKVAGTLPAGGMACPPGTYMKGISNGTPQCVPVVETRCPSGQYVTSINSNGSLNCSAKPPSPCPAQAVPICSGTATLPATPSGQTATVTGGSSFNKTFRCTNGSWSSISFSGSCTCTPSSTTTEIPCGAGFTGTKQVTTALTCPAGTTTTTVSSSACICTGVTDSKKQACASGFEGEIKLERKFTCTSPTAGVWDATWTEVKNTCVCKPQTIESTIACPGGLTGSGIRQERTFKCPEAVWSDPVTISEDCTCVPTTQSQSKACDPGYTGSYTQTRSLSCPAASWSAWSPATQPGDPICKPVPPVVCHWSSLGSPNLGSSGFLRKVGQKCTCGESNRRCSVKIGESSFLNYDSCSCQ